MRYGYMMTLAESALALAKFRAANTLGEVMSKAPSAALMSTKKPSRKPKAGSVAAGSDLLVALAHECENMTREQAFKAVEPLLDDVNHNYIKLGGVLAVVRDHSWWTDVKRESFKDLLENTFGVKYRKGQYLIQIYTDLIKSGVSWDQVKVLGWCKLKELSPIITADNADEWVARAKGMTVLQLHEAVRQYLNPTVAGGGEADGEEKPASDMTTMSFKLHKDQKDLIVEAIEKAKQEANTEFNAVALEAICINYLSGGKTTVKAKSLKAILADYDPEAILKTFGKVFPAYAVEIG